MGFSGEYKPSIGLLEPPEKPPVRVYAGPSQHYKAKLWVHNSLCAFHSTENNLKIYIYNTKYKGW